MNPTDIPLPAQLMNFIIGKWISKPIYAAAELGIADMLADGPMGIDELAESSNSHAPSLYRMIRALASVGIFREKEDAQFELTPMAALLKTGEMRSMAIMFNADWSDKAWHFFLENVKTGNTAFVEAHGMPVTDWLEGNPQAARIFNEANAIKATKTHRAVIDVYDFSGINTIIDVGGGIGALMAEILSEYPAMKGIVADLPSVIRQAKLAIREQHLQDRCQVLACDFFKAVPPGSDAYILSNILHDWPDEQCREILSNCRQAMRNDATLLAIEMIILPGNGPSIAKLLDLEMMVTTGGRERTESDFRDLFASAGLELAKIVPTKEGICVIEGKRKKD